MTGRPASQRDIWRCRRRKPYFRSLVVLVCAALVAPFTGVITANADTAAAVWTERPPLQVARGGHDVAVVGGGILVVGGFDPADAVPPFAFDSVEARRQAPGSSWHTVPPLQIARTNAAAAELGGTVYVVGGFGDDAILDTVETLAPGGRSWTQGPRLPRPRGAAAAAALGGLLYVAGGLVAVGSIREVVTASVLAYDPRTRKWTSVAPMPTPRWRLRLVEAGGHLYAIGGESRNGTTLSTVERYDPRSNTWAAAASMNQGRKVFGVVTVEHGSEQLIVVVGGAQASGPPFLRSTEVYDVQTGRWRLLQAQLPRGKATLVCAVETDGTVLAIGGVVEVNGIGTATAEVLALEIR